MEKQRTLENLNFMNRRENLVVSKRLVVVSLHRDGG